MLHWNTEPREQRYRHPISLLSTARAQPGNSLTFSIYKVDLRHRWIHHIRQFWRSWPWGDFEGLEFSGVWGAEDKNTIPAVAGAWVLPVLTLIADARDKLLQLAQRCVLFSIRKDHHFFFFLAIRSASVSSYFSSCPVNAGTSFSARVRCPPTYDYLPEFSDGRVLSVCEDCCFFFSTHYHTHV